MDAQGADAAEIRVSVAPVVTGEELKAREWEQYLQKFDEDAPNVSTYVQPVAAPAQQPTTAADMLTTIRIRIAELEESLARAAKDREELAMLRKMLAVAGKKK